MPPDPELLALAVKHLQWLRDRNLLDRIGKKETVNWRVFQAVFDSWKIDKDHHLSTNEIQAATSSVSELSDEQVRTSTREIRAKLFTSWDDQSQPVYFDLPLGTNGDAYWLKVSPRTVKRDFIPLLFRNRIDKLLRPFLEEEKEDVLLVAIQGDRAVASFAAWLTKGTEIIKAKRLRLLVWSPQHDDVAAAVCKHMDELSSQFFTTQRAAWHEWQRLACEHERLTVRRYTSMPVCTATVSPRKILLELLPFNDEARHAVGSLLERPALELDIEKTSTAFKLFKNSFEDLWDANEPKPQLFLGAPSSEPPTL